jgi:predicted dehydrogenase
MIEASNSLKESVKLRYGMVGGGSGSFIGDVHRRAISLDHQAELCAGCFSRSFANTLETGKALGVPEPRLYESYLDMAKEESKREDGINFVVIVTPNNSHYSIAKAFLEQGINVVCDKPVTTDPDDALKLESLAKEKGLLCAVTYTYTGYPMVKHAKELIASGAIGEIRFVNAEYPQEWLAETVTDNKQAAWRIDPAQSGISNCVGDIGSHIENLVSCITGLEIDSLCARLDKMVKGRQLDDNATIMINYTSGAKGLYWCSQVAWGADNGLAVRVIGSKGSLSWKQEAPDYLTLVQGHNAVQILSRGRDKLADGAAKFVRLPSGHPEGYFEALANIYLAYIGAVKKLMQGISLTESDKNFPQLHDGWKGVEFVRRCVESSEKGAVWVTVPCRRVDG